MLRLYSFESQFRALRLLVSGADRNHGLGWTAVLSAIDTTFVNASTYTRRILSQFTRAGVEWQFLEDEDTPFSLRRLLTSWVTWSAGAALGGSDLTDRLIFVPRTIASILGDFGISSNAEEPSLFTIVHLGRPLET